MFKIYVGNLDYKVKIEQLRELFSVFAPIEDLVIPLDAKTKRAKGFAIVMIRDAELGQAAIRAMQGKRLLGRLLIVNEAVKRKKGDPPPITKADLVRQGPFGPRMARFGDPRQRGSRNPRRGMGGRGEGSEPDPVREPGSRFPTDPGRQSTAARAMTPSDTGAVRPSVKPLPAPPPKPSSVLPRPTPLGSALDAGLSGGPPAGFGSTSPAGPRPTARPKAQAKASSPPLRAAEPIEAAPPEAPKETAGAESKAKPKAKPKSTGRAKVAKKKAADQD